MYLFLVCVYYLINWLSKSMYIGKKIVEIDEIFFME